MENTIGARLQQLIKENEQINAKAAEAIGVSASLISDIINDKKKQGIGADIVKKICEHYHISSDWLLGISSCSDEKYEQQERFAIAPEPAIRRSILESAIQCVCHDRNAQYGEPEDNFRTISDFWSLYLGREVTPHDVGIMMALFKIGRIMGGGVKDDNYIDACGYLACAGEIAARLQEGN